MRNLLYIILLTGTGLILGSCKESFEVFAPEEEIWVVYGVLNPEADTQVIRVSKAFQLEGNAYEFSKTYDPSVRGLKISLAGNDHIYHAIPKDIIDKDTSSGDFGSSTHLYQIPTTGDFALREGTSYHLEIRSEEDSGLTLQARTFIPPRPRVISPRVRRTPEEQCLERVAFEDSVNIRFQINPNQISGSAAAYEIRVFLCYKENGVAKTHYFGPTRIFSESRGCSQNGINDMLCYLLPNGAVVRGLRTAFKDRQANYTYQSEPRCNARFAPLSQAVEVQITAIDTFLTTYLRANDPFFFEINNVRPEYSNITGTERALGVFGSIAYHNIPVSMSPCAEYLIGLRKQRPFANCEL